MYMLQITAPLRNFLGEGGYSKFCNININVSIKPTLVSVGVLAFGLGPETEKPFALLTPALK